MTALREWASDHRWTTSWTVVSLFASVAAAIAQILP